MNTPASKNPPPTPITYIYKTVDTLSLEADVFIPTNSTQDKYPVVFAIHGGGFIFGAKEDGYTPKELQEMLSRGWCVVSINYRLAPHVFIKDIVQDIQDAYHWVRTELIKTTPLDLDSVILLGQSAGGALALLGGSMLSPRPQAIIAFYPGFTDMNNPLGYDSSTPVSPTILEEIKTHMKPLAAYSQKKAIADPNDPKLAFFLSVHLVEKKLGWMLVTHNPDESAESILKVLKEYSAVYHVDSKYPPTVLVHGREDKVVPPSQSTGMAKSLEEANVPHLLKLVPGADHIFNYFRMRAGIWEEYILPAFDFAEKYIKRPELKGPKSKL